MKKILSAIIFISITFTFTILFAQPEGILIDNKKAYKNDQRPPVDFPHGVHMMGDMGCKDCHHRYSGGENILDEGNLIEGEPGIKCVDCHSCGNKYNLMQAYHKQCMGCHRKLIQSDKKSGPVLCGDCHPWK